MPPLLLLGAAATAAVVTHARLRRGPLFATFAGVFSGMHTLSTAALGAVLPPGASVVLGALSLPVYAHMLALAKPAWRPTWYRGLVSVPAHLISGTSMLSLPFVAATALGAPASVLVVPLVAGMTGLFDSLRASRGVVAIDLDGRDAGPLGRAKAGDEGGGDGLRIVQITDPHLGPFMSVQRLREVAERAVEADPDLVLLTGDYLTMESNGDASLLAGALAPLRALSGRTFACMGNHDHEAPAVVREGLERAGVRLLVDELATVETRLGEVEVAGYDFRRRGRAEHLAQATASMGARRPGVLRLAMLHDPGAFVSLPEGAAELVFAGHTHGGQLGLLRLGSPLTAVSLASKIPDHGLWAHGKARLYVHRGTGQYGFPLRVGVPAEESVLVVRRQTEVG